MKFFVSKDTEDGTKQSKLKVLCLHGYLSSSDIFSFQLRHLVQSTVIKDKITYISD